MLETVVSKVVEAKRRLKIEREYSRADRVALSDLEDLLKDDIDLVINEIRVTKDAINRRLESVEQKEDIDQFLFKKTNEALEELDNHSIKLQKINKLKKLRFKDMYEVYSRVTKARKLIMITREYSYRIKEDIITKNLK